MIKKSFANGKVHILITDKAFGHVPSGDKTMKSRIKKQGISVNHVASMDQIHGAKLTEIEGDRCEPACDGLYTSRHHQLLYTKTADCCPVLLWNETTGMIAAIHAGWRGLLAGIIDSLENIRHGDHPIDMGEFKAFLGPHLRVENFEIQPDFIPQVPPDKHHLLESQRGKTHFNLTKAVIEALQQHNMTNIEDCGIDTYTDPNYFSYRRWCQLPVEQRPTSYSTFANCIWMTE